MQVEIHLKIFFEIDEFNIAKQCDTSGFCTFATNDFQWGTMKVEIPIGWYVESDVNVHSNQFISEVRDFVYSNGTCRVERFGEYLERNPGDAF